jgi:hypothetical protein
MGLDVYLYEHEPANDDDDSGEVRHNSEHTPDHLFKIGYFRSSYNPSGFDTVLHESIGEDLYTIFDVGHDSGYIIKPNWNEARAKAVSVREKYLEFLNKTKGFTTVSVHSSLDFMESDGACLEMFLIEHSKAHIDSYSNKYGTFFTKNQPVVHAVFTKKGFMRPEIVLVVSDGGVGVEENWYMKALDIVIETIDYVLGKPDWQNYVLHWSG